MRTILFAAVLALGAGAACSKSETKKVDKVEKDESKIPLMSVADVDAAIAKGDCVAVDANGEKTRKKMGIVPGAVLLTDSEAFALSELPADKAKQLVFYCGGVKCTASDEAANRASVKCVLRNWWENQQVKSLSRELFGNAEGGHATPSEVSVTWFLHPEHTKPMTLDPAIAPHGSFADAHDYRRAFPDGRIGSNPGLATVEAGKRIFDAAVGALTADYKAFAA